MATKPPVTLEALQARNNADIRWLGIASQHEHLLDAIPLDHSPTLGELAPIINAFEFYIGAINRLLRLANLIQIEFADVDLQGAIASFNVVSPHIREIRDTVEHFDQYSKGTGNRQKKGEPVSDLNFTIALNEVIISYASFTVPLGATTAAVADLHRAMREALDPLTRSDPGWHPPIVENLPNASVIRSGAGLQRRRRHYPPPSG